MNWQKSASAHYDYEKNLVAGRIVLATVRHSIGSKGQPDKAYVTIRLPGIKRDVAQRLVVLEELPVAMEDVETVVSKWIGEITP